MSRHWAHLLIAIAFLSVGALAGALIMPRTVEAAKESPKAVPPRIAYVNIAKVMREFAKAKAEGDKITHRRQQFVDEALVIREEGRRLAKEAETTDDKRRKAALEMDALDAQRKLQDLERRGQKELTEMTDRIVVDMYQNIKGVIAEIASERGLDVVEAYPDSSTAEEDLKPVVAQMKLQAPALFPMFVRKEFVLTDELIERLNRKYPPVNERPGI